jgi:hypothetical protein
MEGVLKFNRDDPSEERKFQLASHAADWASIVWNIDQWLHGKVKYINNNDLDVRTLEAVRDYFIGLIADSGVTLDDYE